MLNSLALIRILAIVKDGRMKVTISYMAEDTGKEAEIVNLFLCNFYQKSAQFRILLSSVSLTNDIR